MKPAQPANRLVRSIPELLVILGPFGNGTRVRDRSSRIEFIISYDYWGITENFTIDYLARCMKLSSPGDAILAVDIAIIPKTSPVRLLPRKRF